MSMTVEPRSFDVILTEEGKILDFLSSDLLEPKPEEFVRQKFLRILHYEYGYPENLLAREVPIYHGSREITDKEGAPVRADIVVYNSSTARAAWDQGNIRLLIECKAPTETTGYNQLVFYIFNTSAAGGVWFNDSGAEDQIQYFRRLTAPEQTLVPWPGIPRPMESWDAIGRRKKADLVRPKDIKGLLRRCHNKLHGRGSEGEEEDLTMDMVRLILAKAQDEEQSGEYPKFYCTPEELLSKEGRAAVTVRVTELFEEVKSLNTQVFSSHERITVGDIAVCNVVIELQPYQLLADLSSSDGWDIMGHAYEEYTATYLKRKKGQFFTNRLITDFLVAAVDPSYTDIVLDPAGGSGGFLTAALRHIRNKILVGTGTSTSKQRQLDRIRTRLFMVDISKRLVKIAKTAMILNGDGHTGMTQGDALGPYLNFDETILAMAGRNVPTVILTNPPFAGVGEGRVTDAETLSQFATGHTWNEIANEYTPTEHIVSEGVPPEVLFFERCLDWVAPNGRVGIVMPKSFLDTQTFFFARYLLLTKCQLLAVVNCHKDTFQPHTGVRTCLLIFRKLAIGEELPEDYSIFMAISKKIGQDSEGRPIHKRDKTNKLLDEIDHDLNEHLQAFHQFLAGNLEPSEYAFSINFSEIDKNLRINPQAFLPSLNETLQHIAGLDGLSGWSVTTVGQMDNTIRIFKGPRFKSENLIVDSPDGEGVEPYYTPSAILQEKGDSVKWLDISRANASQLRAISAIRVNQGDIVITRSGTIGRIAYITKNYDRAIVSDDLIRVRVSNELLRKYIYSYLQTKYAQDQILLNEYGAVQQHLEPEHVRDILIPVPEGQKELESLLEEIGKLIQYKEQVAESLEKSLSLAHGLVRDLITRSAEKQPEKKS